MKRSTSTFAYVMPVLLCLLSAQQVRAQGYDNPLTFQGLSRTTNQSVPSRSAGGIVFGVQRDVSFMFALPASLSSVRGVQLSVGGLQQSSYFKQDQRYSGIQGTSAFAPLMESTTGLISDPDTTGANPESWTQADSVQRPFDSIGPNWNRSKSSAVPVQFFAAAPFSLGGMRVVGGIGVVEYANLGWYYQNNNCLSPALLSIAEMGTIGTTGLDRNPYPVQWYQYYQERDGSIMGYGAALSASPNENLSIGLSAMILKGSTDDKEVRVGRGRMLFFTNSMRLDRPGTTSSTKTGTSDYSGTEFTLSAEYKSRYFEAGFSLKPPTTITRTFSTAVSQDSVALSKMFLSKVDSIRVQSNASISGEDNMELPWRGTFGFGLKIRENLNIGLSYEVRSYASARYSGPLSAVPWLSCSILHVGAELQAAPWLVLRGGVSQYAEVFQPLTSGIRGESVNYPIYALGATVRLAGATLNLAYEYSDMKFVDTWANAVSINREIKNTIVASMMYEIPWGE